MFGAKSSSNSNVWRSSILGAMLFTAIFVLLPIFAGAQCARWDAGGVVAVAQQGQAFTITLTLEQKGSVITGTADALQWTNADHKGTKTLGGTVDGTIEGNNFNIQIFWRNGQTGVYNAKVLPSGRLDGEGYEVNTPNVRVRWHSDGVLKCAPRPGGFPVSALPTFGGTGAAPKPPPRTTRPAPPPKPPFITTGQVIVQPYVPVASVYLGWDGGPDHPNAQLDAVNEDGQTLMFKEVFKKPKGGVELRLQRGRQYMYVLKDGGVTLSTVNLVVP